ncbi:hypothetical protein BJ742DRAFT_855389 [Cladochytrium replicatum]|nr:hypothetical protein BJ742DRAFT_855389 [Cladochytrium replicatum]
MNNGSSPRLPPPPPTKTPSATPLQPSRSRPQLASRNEPNWRSAPAIPAGLLATNPIAAGTGSKGRPGGAQYAAAAGNILKKGKRAVLWLHENNHNRWDKNVVVSADYFPGMCVGDLLELVHPNVLQKDETVGGNQDGVGSQTLPKPKKKVRKPKRLIVQVSYVEKERTQLQISLPQSLASALNVESLASGIELQNRMEILVKAVEASSVTADYLELQFRDQYVGRSDMWRLKMSMMGTCVYLGKPAETLGISAKVKGVYIDGNEALTAYVTDSTKFVYRSESAKYFLFIQVSKEMREFDEDGEVYFEKCVHGFLAELFARWRDLRSNHVVSIILFTRFSYRMNDMDMKMPSKHVLAEHSMNVNESGVVYRDFYRVVVDWETRADWTQIITPLKHAFFQFEREVSEVNTGDLEGKNMAACEGNILEAINLALNPFDKHYIDRDLQRTGLSIVVVTPGAGYFEVNKKLLRLTTQRMIDNGIGLDLVCLSKPPLHAVPLFQFHLGEGNPTKQNSASVNEDAAPAKTARSPDDQNPSASTDRGKPNAKWDPLYTDSHYDDFGSEFYNIPSWVECSFWNSKRDNRESALQRDFPEKAQQFTPRCRMEQVQMGAVEPYRAIMMAYLEPTDPSARHHSNVSQEESNASLAQMSNNDGEDGEGATLKRTPKEMVTSTEVQTFSDFDKYDAAVFKRAEKVSEKGSETTNNIKPSITSQQVSPNNDLEQDSNAREIKIEPSEVLDYQTSESKMLEVSRGTASQSVAIPGAKVDDGIQNLSPSGDRNVQAAPSSSVPIRMRNSYQRTYLDASKPSFTGPESFKSGSPINIGKGASPGKYSAPLPVRHSPFLSTINPFSTARTPTGRTSQQQRWQHAFLHSVDPIRYEAKVNWKSLCSPACLPLTTDYSPTEEELNSDTKYTLKPFEFTPHDISPYLADSSSEKRKVELLFVEMVSQRLAQGFQMITTNADVAKVKVSSTTGAGKHVAARNSLGGVLQHFDTSIPRYFSLGDHVHWIYYNPESPRVELRAFARKIAYDDSSIPYTCAIWPKHTDHYHQKTVMFSYPSLSQYNWNKLDNHISGYREDMTEDLRFWRARFLLIPLHTLPQNTSPANEHFSEEEQRIELFKQFIELVERARWIGPIEQEELERQKKEIRAEASQTIKPITFTAVQYVEDELRKAAKRRLAASAFASAVQQSPRPTEVQNQTPTIQVPTDATSGDASSSTDGSELASSFGTSPPAPYTLTQLASYNQIAELIYHPVHGLKIQSMRWHRKIYERVFVGCECVDWLIKAFSDINTRAEAINFGNELLSNGFFTHANRNHRFLDGHYFYHISNKYSRNYLPPSEPSWLSGIGKLATMSPSMESPDSKLDIPPNADLAKSEDKVGQAPSSRVLEYERQRKMQMLEPVELSQRITIDMDEKKRSNRREIAYVHYDTLYNPKHCYHLQLHWLVCTARLIEDILQLWSRNAEKCGMKLVEAPVEQAVPFADDNPFQTVVSVQLELQPPPREEILKYVKDALHIPPMWLETEIVKSFGFILDLEADDQFRPGTVTYSYEKPRYKYTQYVHRSGIAFIQIREPGMGFYWTVNRLLVTSSSASGNLGGSAMNISEPPPSLRGSVAGSPAAGFAAVNGHNLMPKTPHMNVRPETLLDQFTKFCSDIKALEEFYSKSLNRLFSIKKSAESNLDDLPDDVATNILVQIEDGEKQVVEHDAVEAAQLETIVDVISAQNKVAPPNPLTERLIDTTTRSIEANISSALEAKMEQAARSREELGFGPMEKSATMASWFGSIGNDGSRAERSRTFSWTSNLTKGIGEFVSGATQGLGHGSASTTSIASSTGGRSGEASADASPGPHAL